MKRETPTFKECSGCHRALPLSLYNKARHGKHGVQGYCRACQRRSILRRRGARVEGLPMWEFVPDDDQRCEICDRAEPNGHGQWRRDHCHTTGALRGWLCASCNLALGRIPALTAFQQKAANYMARYCN